MIDLEAPAAPPAAPQPPSPVRRHAGLGVTAAVLALCGASAIGQELTTRPTTMAAVLGEQLVHPTGDAWAAGLQPAVPPTTARPLGAATARVTAPLPPPTAPTSPPLRIFVLGDHCWPLGASAVTARGTPIMCTRLDPQGRAYDDLMARWRRI